MRRVSRANRFSAVCTHTSKRPNFKIHGRSVIFEWEITCSGDQLVRQAQGEGQRQVIRLDTEGGSAKGWSIPRARMGVKGQKMRLGAEGHRPQVLVQDHALRGTAVPGRNLLGTLPWRQGLAVRGRGAPGAAGDRERDWHLRPGGRRLPCGTDRDFSRDRPGVRVPDQHPDLGRGRIRCGGHGPVHHRYDLDLPRHRRCARARARPRLSSSAALRSCACWR